MGASENSGCDLEPRCEVKIASSVALVVTRRRAVVVACLWQTLDFEVPEVVLYPTGAATDCLYLLDVFLKALLRTHATARSN